MANGYAAVSSEGIFIDTASSTERAAMVNWLVTQAHFMVPAGMSEFAIREHFKRLAEPEGVFIAKVLVTIVRES